MRLQIYTEVYFCDGKVWLNVQSLTQKFPKYETPYERNYSKFKTLTLHRDD